MKTTPITRFALLGSLVMIVILSPAFAEAVTENQCTVRLGDSGRAEVRLATGEEVLLGAFPAVWRSPASEPVPLEMPPSRARVEQADVVDSLGKGSVLRITHNGCTLHVTTYAEMPYLTVQLVYTNVGTDTEQIRALIPWAMEDGCTLGAATNRAAILDNGILVSPKVTLHTSEDKEVSSLWNLAAYNPSNGRSLIAGFLSNEKAYSSVRITRNTDLDAQAFAFFQAECRYDPPVALAPGETLRSELLYLSVGEASPFQGLERFAANVAAFNGLRPTRRALPHGWDSWVTHYHKDVTEKALLAELDLADKHLKRYGWTHFSIDDGWQKTAGDWQADPERFPSGMKAFADAVHARGMTAGLWTEPFTVDIESSLAKEHPEWLAEPNAMGRTLLGDDERILDITVPGARAFVRETYAMLVDVWGYDALVETDFVYHLLAAEAYADPAVTRPQALQTGMRAIRDGAGDKTFIMGVAPYPLVGGVADGMRTGIDCAPIWRSTPDTWAWGCVDTLTNAARRYYFSPHVFALDQDCAFFGHQATRKRWKVTELPELTRAQQIAWMTGAALTGGALKIGDAFSVLDPEEFDILRRLLPVMPQPARPVDLFERKEPCVWSLPIDAPIGKWHLVGVFNWDESAEATIPLSFAQLGLESGAEYAVFDFWPGDYCGLARERMDLKVPAGSVRLLSFRPYEKRPMLLATDSHFSQGATDFTGLEWRSEERVLAGRFEGIADTTYVLSVLVPEGYTPSKTRVSVGAAQVEHKGEVARLTLHCDSAGPVDWHMRF